MAQAGQSSASSSSSSFSPVDRGSGATASPSVASSINGESSGAASSSYSGAREEEHQFGELESEQQHIGLSRGIFFAFNSASAIRDDTWSCVIVVLTFWFFGWYF